MVSRFLKYSVILFTYTASFVVYASQCDGGSNISGAIQPVYLHAMTVDKNIAANNLQSLMNGLQIGEQAQALSLHAIAQSKLHVSDNGLELCNNMQVADSNNVQLEDNDPYNFGVLKVISLDHVTTQMGGMARTYISIDMVWAHIGQEANEAEGQKFPEVRFTASEFHIKEFEETSGWPSDVQMAGYYKKAYNETMASLLKKVGARYRRKIDFNARDRQYISVATPQIPNKVLDVIRATHAPELAERMIKKLPQWLASLIESRLALNLQQDQRFSNLALLPNLEMSQELLSNWSEFTDMAKNNTSRTQYAGNESSLNKKPLLRKVAPLCDWELGKKLDGVVTVPGFELRNMLGLLTIEKGKKLQRGVYAYTMTTGLGEQVRIPLASEVKALYGATDKKGKSLKMVVTRYVHIRKKQESIPLQTWLGPDWLGWSLAHVVDASADDLVERLALSLKERILLTETNADTLQSSLCTGVASL